MSNVRLNIRATLIDAIDLYRCSFSKLLPFAIPLFAVSHGLSGVADSETGFAALGLSVLSYALSSLTYMLALRKMLEASDQPCVRGVASLFRVYALFLFVSAYIDLVTSMGFVFLLVPALLIYSSAILAPVMVLCERLGPFEAIAESVSRTKGNIWLIVWLNVLITLIFASGAGISYWLLNLLLVVPKWLSFAFEVCFGILALYANAVMIVVYNRLHPNTPVNLTTESGALSEHAAARGCRLPSR